MSDIQQEGSGTPAEPVKSEPLGDTSSHPRIDICGIRLEWDLQRGTCSFGGLPVAMAWIDSTLVGLLSGVQAMVGTERFALALQQHGRQSIEDDWAIIQEAEDFPAGFAALAVVAATAGWGRWELVELDMAESRAVFRIHDSWEGRFQRKIGVQWGANLLAGKLAGYCSRLFGVNCWAEQRLSIALGEACDEFVVSPSPRSVEQELERLLDSDNATRADMAVALNRLRSEVESRSLVELELRTIQCELEKRVQERASALAKTAEQFRVSEQRFRDVIQTLPMGVHLYRLREDNSLLFEGANPAADTILGVDNARFLGMDLEDAFPLLATTDVPASYREVCLTGTPLRRERQSFQSTSTRRSFDIHAFRTGERTMAVLFQDVSEQLRAEQEREVLRESLNRSRRMEALGLLAGTVAHDLNNILTGLTSYPELLLMELPESSPHRAMVEAIMASGLRAVAVVEDLLTVARGIAVVHQPVDLGMLVRELLESPEILGLRERFPGVSLGSELESGLPLAKGSGVHLRKAIMNLIVNGLEAVGEMGSVIVRLGLRHLDEPPPGWPEVVVGDYVFLSVEDSGCGIGPEDIERIFEPFYSRKVLGHSGTGLGLTIVWTTVREHGGFVEVGSEPGATKISMHLPATSHNEKVEEGLPRSPLARGVGGRILVVDDESILREVTSRMLVRLGYEPCAVDSGEAALAFLRTKTVDAVVLDMVMPGGMGGRETYERMAALHPGIPTILVSGYAETEAVRRAQSLGAGAFLRKPFRIAQLGDVLKRLLASKARPIP